MKKLPDIKSARGLILLAILVAAILMLALILLPAISERSGFSINTIALIGAALCFIFAFGSMALRKGGKKKHG